MQNKKFDIIFENDDIIVVNKKPEIFVINNEITILDILKENLRQEIFPINSLDYEASGIVLFAKNKKQE